MHQNPELPQRLPDLSEEMRLFLAGVRPEEIQNLKLLVTLREDEREALQFIFNRFTMEDLGVIADSLENLRTMKRFGKFGMVLFGFIIAGAGAAAAIKVFFGQGVPKL